MDDERFYELIQRTFDAVRDLNLKQHPDNYTHTLLMELVEREIRDRQLKAAADRVYQRLMLVGPGGVTTP